MLNFFDNMFLRNRKKQFKLSVVLNIILICVILTMMISGSPTRIRSSILNNSIFSYTDNFQSQKPRADKHVGGIFGVYLNASKESLCYGRGNKKEEFFKKHENVVDPLKLGPFDFLPEYKNPCFLHNFTIKGNVTSEVRCIPYFHIAGMPKSGTTDLWHTLSYHPSICVSHFKEPMWFNRKRFSGFTFKSYLDFLKPATKAVMEKYSPETCHKNIPYHHLIIGEGSVDYSFDNNRWSTFPGNENCNEPVILNPHHIYHINPATKLIFMFRNPVDRIYSDYIYESRYIGYNKSQEDFHINVLQNMIKHVECRMSFTQRGCAYDFRTENFEARLRVGMYHIFIEDWLRVFPRQQFLFIKFEDYASNTEAELSRVCQHLDVRPILPEEIIRIKKRKIQNTRSKADDDLGDMWPSTRTLLEKFYKPFNENLARLLNDEKFLWK